MKILGVSTWLRASLCSMSVLAAGSALAPSAFAGLGSGESEHSVAREWNDQLLNAIRRDFPAPTVHARNLFHTSVAMYDAWAVYDDVAVGYIFREKLDPPASVDAARHEAVSYAAYRVLSQRYSLSTGAVESLASFDQHMAALGYDTNITTTVGSSPAAVGNRIAQQILDHFLHDGANELHNYVDVIGYAPVNEPLIFELPGAFPEFPNQWQPLVFDFQITQNGIELGESVQEFVSPHWGYVESFAIGESDENGLHYDLGAPPQLGGQGDQRFKDDLPDVIWASSILDPDNGLTIDLSPGAMWNNDLGTDSGTGYPVNPVTGEPYEPNVVKLGDWGRCIAEFWADGPQSETPPGHWNTLANDVNDTETIARRIGGEGPELEELEWDVKLYLALNGAVHDAAVAAWGMKSHYDYVRPISMIRHCGGKGQSSYPPDPENPNEYRDLAYHPEGLQLIPGLIEVITNETRETYHSHFPSFYRGRIAVKSWGGAPVDPENNFTGAEWMLATSWNTYQRTTFVTPAFAGYISGHSTFSRAAAEVMTAFTGSAYFPGGLGTYTFPAHEYLEFEDGPSEELTLTWATYYDAADEAGRSRVFGGIHVYVDDYDGRIIGSMVGEAAFARAMQFYRGDIELRVDLNNDGKCDATDLAEVLNNWGPCGGCPADFNGDGVVNAVELAEILNAWTNTSTAD